MVGFCPGCVGMDPDAPLMRPFSRAQAGGMPVTEIAPERWPRVIQLFQGLAEESGWRTPQSRTLSQAWIALLLGELCRGGRAPKPATTAPTSLTLAALDFIQRQALEPISLRDVAAAVHRSPAHVASTVKRSTGFTVGDWIRSARVAEAASWLIHSDESLDDIAARVGWQDKTHFIRQFRREHGVTPAAFRRSQRQ